jgi:hypothetical protein
LRFVVRVDGERPRVAGGRWGVVALPRRVGALAAVAGLAAPAAFAAAGFGAGLVAPAGFAAADRAVGFVAAVAAADFVAVPLAAGFLALAALVAAGRAFARFGGVGDPIAPFATSRIVETIDVITAAASAACRSRFSISSRSLAACRRRLASVARAALPDLSARLLRDVRGGCLGLGHDVCDRRDDIGGYRGSPSVPLGSRSPLFDDHPCLLLLHVTSRRER